MNYLNVIETSRFNFQVKVMDDFPKTSSKEESGYSLIELLVVIGILGLIATGVVSFGENLNTSTKLSDSAARLNTFIKSVQMRAKYQKNCAKLEYSPNESKIIASYYDNSLDCTSLIGAIQSKTADLDLDRNIAVAGASSSDPIVVLRNGSLMNNTDRMIQLSAMTQVKTIKVMGLTGKVSIQ